MSHKFRMARRHRVAVALGFGLTLGAHASEPPLAPTVVMVPRAGETYAAFQQHDLACRTYAFNASSAAGVQQRPGASAAIGAGVGAAAGALIGSASGHASNGAAIGAGTGLLIGAVSGQQNASKIRAAEQQQYDTVYTQCMVANGERVPAPPPVVVAPPRVIYVAPSPPTPPPVIVYRAYPPY